MSNGFSSKTFIFSQPGNPGRGKNEQWRDWALFCFGTILTACFTHLYFLGYDESVDLTEALKDHYDPELVKSKLVEVHNWLKKDNSLTDEERVKLGWKRGYNLTTWEEFPGENLMLGHILHTSC